MRSELLGEAFSEWLNQNTYDDPIMQKFRDLSAETVFGALWTRPGRDPELELHVRMARRQGWTEEELTEVLLHMSGYVGVPLIREALLTASWVFQEMRHEELLPET